jgi:holo-[acyl-carrier protein] synthase
MIGIDLVHVPGFAEQLSAPGSRFTQAVFTPGELLVAGRRGLTGPAWARHLAGRWAAKEAFIKAWSQALFGAPAPIERDQLDWRDIEVQPDAYGRVRVVLHGDVSRHFHSGQWRLGPSLSISHDGDYAIAIVRLD